jgi:hypothetical protein
VATKGDIDTEAFLRVLGPFFRAAQGTLDPAFQDRVCRKVFSKFITDFARENMVRDDSSIDENRRFEEVDSKAVQGLIFNIASDDDTIEKNRRKLYLLHQEFPALTGKQFVDTDAMEEEEEEVVKVKVTKKEKKLRQINAEVADMKIVEKEKGTKSVKVTEEIEKKLKKADKVESKIEDRKVEKKVEKKEEKKVEKKEEKVEKIEEKKESKKEKRGRAEFEEDDLSAGNDLTAMILKKKAANGTEDLSAAADKLKMKQKERADKTASEAAPAPVVAVAKAVSPSPSLPLASFIASKKFTGAKTNYVFKNVSTACCFEYVPSFHGLDVQLKASVYCSSSELY